jgi:hypothetical protein
MSRTLHTLRASFAIGALLLAGGALQSAHAADANVQRVAMAGTHSSDAGVTTTRHTAAMQRADTAAKAHERRARDARVVSQHSDGTRFTYDSCGCSN